MTATGLRPIGEPVLVAAPSGRACTTRVRVTPTEDAVLAQVAAVIAPARRSDLRARSRAGVSPGKEALAARKKQVTVGLSSRWAGSIVRHNDAQYAFARRNQAAHLQSLGKAIGTIEARLAAPVGGHAPAPKGSRRRTVKGYATADERAMKQRRLQHLVAEQARVRADYRAGVVHVVEGGRRLARRRHNLIEANSTVQDWRAEWDAERDWFHANGSPDEPYGNLTITVSPAGEVSIRLPACLEHLANAPRGRFVLSQPVSFTHNGDEWATHITPTRHPTSGRTRSGAVSYRFHRKPGRAGWYLTASWTTTHRDPVTDLAVAAPALDRPARILGVDTNTDHLAAWVLDEHGNPVGPPVRFDWDLTGTSSRRDAQVRHTLTRLIRHALRHGCEAVAVEQLGFDDARATGRETMGRGPRGKTFRRTVAGIPAGIVRNRLAAMTARNGLTLLAVNPAYTSKWGAQHWQQPLTAQHPQTTGHAAAAVVIGRRAQGHPARRRKGKPVTRPADRERTTTLQTDPGPDPARMQDRPPCPDTPPDGDAPHGPNTGTCAEQPLPRHPRPTAGTDNVQQNE